LDETRLQGEKLSKKGNIMGLNTAMHAAGLVLAGVLIGAAPARAALPNCNVAVLAGLGVANVTIVAAVDVPASGANPEFCSVQGTVRTTGFGAPDGSARFELQLPSPWNGKFLFFGVGGFAGSLFPSANLVDVLESLPKGYATIITDTGHVAGGTDASWALIAPGVPDEAKIIDYYFRATHRVTQAGKGLVEAYYRTSIARAYFDGCSNGGRMAYMEAARFPEDFDGIVAGAPFLDIRVLLAALRFHKTQLAGPNAYIPFTKLPMVDAAVRASCDAVDGVTDGLIQNPSKCAFDPNTLVSPTCAAGDPTCLTPEQGQTLAAYFTALRGEEGEFIYTGQAVSDLDSGDGMDLWTTGFVAPTSFTAAEPWGNFGFTPAPISWQFMDHLIQFIVKRDPTFGARSFDNGARRFDDEALDLFDRRTEAGDADDPDEFTRFFAQNRKLLAYHGFSDPALPAFRTIKHYEAVARRAAGFDELRKNMRLFMAPGMHHCGGGPGPNLFDTLGALEAWVEHGIAPDALPATHFVNNNPALGVDRTMPLCAFPDQAQYSGSGNVNSAANWACAGNRRLLEVGPNGRQAGLSERDNDRDEDRGDHDHGDQ
jgi:feruloyl esterase